MINHILFAAALILWLALGALLVGDYWLYVTGQPTLSDWVAGNYSSELRTAIASGGVAFILGLVLGHWAWPTRLEN